MVVSDIVLFFDSKAYNDIFLLISSQNKQDFLFSGYDLEKAIERYGDLITTDLRLTFDDFDGDYILTIYVD